MSLLVSRYASLASAPGERNAGGVPEPLETAAPASTPAPVGIVVTGDNHLSAYLPRLTPQRRAERRAHLRDGFAAAARYAIAHRASLFAQVGDLFDTPTPSNEDRAFVARTFAELRAAGIACVGIGGNHDTPRLRSESGGEAPQSVYAAFDGLRYFARDDALVPELLTLGGLRVVIAGLTNNPVAPPGSDPLVGIPIVDELGVLARADVGLLLLHAGIEGLCRETEGERIVRRATLAGLPDIFRGVLAGHIHRFGKQHIGARGVVVCGATERMEFGAASGSSGFAWVEIDRGGLRRAEHIKTNEQPRADILLPTSRLWPGGAPESVPHSADALEGPPSADVLEPVDTAQETLVDVAPDAGFAGAHPPDDVLRGLWRRTGTPEEDDPLAVIRAAVAEFCTPDTMVRLRLAGPLTLDQYHALPLREALHFGQQRAFSFDLDTSDLLLLEPGWPRRRTTSSSGGGPISPVRELDALLAEGLEGEAPASPAAEELRAAAELLRACLREARDREASR